MRPLRRGAALLAAGIMVVSLSAGAFAQKGVRGARAGKVMFPPALMERLNLTEEQQTKLKAAQEAFRGEMSKLRGAGNGKEKRQTARAARATYEAALQATLTSEQLRQLQAMREESRDYRSLGRIGRQLVGLGLTDEQKAKIKEIVAKYEPEQAKLRAARKDAADRTATRSQMRELQRKIADDVRAVLTPEQQKQLAPPWRARRAIGA